MLSNIARDDRILITGASGWLGREAMAMLRRSSPEVSVMAIAREARQELISGELISFSKWVYADIAAWQPTVVLHLAYLTQDRIAEMPEAAYREANRRITNSAIEILKIDSVRAAVVLSSGAAVQERQTLYGEMKMHDEQAFQEIGNRLSVSLQVARGWSFSGAFCTKPSKFALYDLIRQAMFSETIQIQSLGIMRRRYVDAGQYLQICLEAACNGESGVIDSTGVQIEIGELADAICSEFGQPKPIIRPRFSEPPSNYFSASNEMEAKAVEFGISLSDLPAQIRRSQFAVNN